MQGNAPPLHEVLPVPLAQRPVGRIRRDRLTRLPLLPCLQAPVPSVSSCGLAQCHRPLPHLLPVLPLLLRGRRHLALRERRRGLPTAPAGLHWRRPRLPPGCRPPACCRGRWGRQRCRRGPPRRWISHAIWLGQLQRHRHRSREHGARGQLATALWQHADADDRADHGERWHEVWRVGVQLPALQARGHLRGRSLPGLRVGGQLRGRSLPRLRVRCQPRGRPPPALARLREGRGREVVAPSARGRCGGAGRWSHLALLVLVREVCDVGPPAARRQVCLHGRAC
mmetsp:Transcript_44287/g.119492  ORF Transcript_44287/g.119492 Transcript_44287/m.119492 type:complete len:283 (-) Transcript_44287:120-968(-)